MRLRLLIQYDGTEYHGWQLQPNAPTVQGALEAALSRIDGGRRPVHGAGRTDAGVHALGQVAHADVVHERDPETWRRALNANLPLDIRISAVEMATNDFHARRSAVGKLYRYRVWTGEVLSPFDRRYCHHLPRPLDVAAMRAVAARLVGKHDFRAFTLTDRDTETSVRTLRRLDVRTIEHGVEFEAEADGFLRAMVRSMVGTLLAAGEGKCAADSVESALATGRRVQAGATAPAVGLTLVRVDY